MSDTWLRPTKHVPPARQQSVRAIAGVGLVGDCHAEPRSPRQILLASTGVYQRLGLAPATLRESVTLNADPSVWPSGSLVALGPEVVLRVMFRCEPCARLNAYRPGLHRAVGSDRGLLARVIRGGTINVGDTVALSPPIFRAWSDAWEDRLVDVVRSIPSTEVTDFLTLAKLIGVASAYCRVFPRSLEKHGALRARVVAGASLLGQAPWSGDTLFADELATETLIGA